MHAFVLAAGLGSRLRPLTERTPKCLVPICGRPLLAYWFDLLAQHGVNEVLVNSHYLPDQVEAFVQHYPTPLRVTLRYEPVLLGSAGTLRANRAFVEGVPDFFVIYADNLTNANLTELKDAHRRAGQVATLGLFRALRPEDCGIASLDSQGTIVAFEEKPPRPSSNLAFAGVMMAGQDFLEAIPDQPASDIGRDVLGQLTGRMAGMELNAYLRDIGTPESYERAQIEAPELWP